MEIQRYIHSMYPETSEAHIKQIAIDMASGKSWKHILKEYDCTNIYINKPKQSKFPFTDEQVHQICKIFEVYDKFIPNKSVLDKINFYYGDLNKKMARIGAHLSLIRYKKIKMDICNLYNY